MRTSNKIALVSIFLIVLAVRLYFAFQTPYFSSDDAYFHIRNADYITENFKPIFHDDLSYGGRYLLNSHVFHYVLAAFNFILPSTLAYKLIPEILLAALVFLVFAIAKELTGNETAALFSALISSVMPIMSTSTLNQVSIYSLTLLLLLYMIYIFFDLRRNVNWLVLLSLLLPLVHPVGFFFAASMIVYLLLARLEMIEVDEISKESITLLVFFNVLIAFLLFKKAFLETGLGAVWQNVPALLLDSYFRNINILEMISSVGVITIIFGIIGFLFALRAKKKSIYVLSAFVLTDFILLALKMVDFNTGLMIFGLLLAIISSIAFDKFVLYFEMTKFNRLKKPAAVAFIILIIASLGIPSLYAAEKTINNALSNDEYTTLTWIRDNTPKMAVVLANIDEGNYIAQIAQRKNVADSYFLLAPDRYGDISTVFTTQSLVNAMNIIKKYNIDYIYFSDRTKEKYGIEEIIYARDENCFKSVFSTESAQVYRILC